MARLIPLSQAFSMGLVRPPTGGAPTTTTADRPTTGAAGRRLIPLSQAIQMGLVGGQTRPQARDQTATRQVVGRGSTAEALPDRTLRTLAQGVGAGSLVGGGLRTVGALSEPGATRSLVSDVGRDLGFVTSLARLPLTLSEPDPARRAIRTAESLTQAAQFAPGPVARAIPGLAGLQEATVGSLTRGILPAGVEGIPVLPAVSAALNLASAGKAFSEGQVGSGALDLVSTAAMFAPPPFNVAIPVFTAALGPLLSGSRGQHTASVMAERKQVSEAASQFQPTLNDLEAQWPALREQAATDPAARRQIARSVVALANQLPFLAGGGSVADVTRGGTSGLANKMFWALSETPEGRAALKAEAGNLEPRWSRLPEVMFPPGFASTPYENYADVDAQGLFGADPQTIRAAYQAVLSPPSPPTYGLDPALKQRVLQVVGSEEQLARVMENPVSAGAAKYQAQLGLDPEDRVFDPDVRAYLDFATGSA